MLLVVFGRRAVGAWAAGLIVAALLAAPLRAQSSAPIDTTPADTAAADASRLYAIQLSASNDSGAVAAEAEALRQRAVPAYAAAKQTGGATYRLRVGPFTSVEAARAFAAFHGYEGAWIGPAAQPRGAAAPGRAVGRVVTDAYEASAGLAYYLLGQAHPLLAILRPRVGADGALLPAALRLYLADRPQPVLAENVTGVAETPTAVEMGRAVRVFDDPLQAPTETVAVAIEAFSEAVGLERAVVQDRLAYYEDGKAAWFTMLSAYDLARDTLVVRAEPGFDYVRPTGEREVFTGAVSQAATYRKGSARMRGMNEDAPLAVSGERVAFYARPAAGGAGVELCVAFFQQLPPDSDAAAAARPRQP